MALLIRMPRTSGTFGLRGQISSISSSHRIHAAGLDSGVLLDENRSRSRPSTESETSMQTIHHHTEQPSAPETTGHTLHQAGHYDRFSRLMGLGINQSNSRMVVEMAGIGAGQRVLDAACGTGNLTLTASARVGESGSIVGIDASPEMIEAARANALRTGLRAEFALGVVEKIDAPDASFDVVISRLAIHHLPDDLKRRAFSEFLRVLKPGGRLFIADFKRPSNFLLSHLLLIFIGHGMMRTDMGGLPAMLKDAGFASVTSGPTGSAYLAYIRGEKPRSP